MQRLGDIVAADLHYIINDFRDFTRETTIQCGSIKKIVFASLQDANVVFTADISPKNAFSTTLLFEDPKDAQFMQYLAKDSIIYVDSEPCKIIDCATVRGLVVLSLERKKGR